MLTTLIMLYGFSFLYGLTGTTRFSGHGPQGRRNARCTRGALLRWSACSPSSRRRRSTSGHPTPTPALLRGRSRSCRRSPRSPVRSRSSDSCPPYRPDVTLAGTVLLVVSAASMVLGNLGALTQTDVRRMMAYSGVAHSGYLLLGVAALSRPGSAAAIFYALAYAIPSMGIMLVTAEEGTQVTDFGGLVQRRPATAWATVIMLFSLIGIPPLVGILRQAGALHGRTAARLHGGGGVGGGHERGVGGVLPAHRASDVLRRGARRARRRRTKRTCCCGDRRCALPRWSCSVWLPVRFWPRSAPYCASALTCAVCAFCVTRAQRPVLRQYRCYECRNLIERPHREPEVQRCMTSR